MATIDKQCGAWRTRVRRNGISRTKTFTKKSDAAHWALETERSIALGLPQGDDVDGLPFAQRLLAMTYAQAGQTQKAEAAVKRFLEGYPDFTIAQHMDDKQLQCEEDRAHYAEGLEKASLPA